MKEYVKIVLIKFKYSLGIAETKGWNIISFFIYLSKAIQQSVQFSSVVPLCLDSLRPHESQHARPPCPSPTPRVYSDSCPSSR